jgi:tetratricopeptide (TPR) repeat protein
MTARLIPFRSRERRLSAEDGSLATKKVLSTPIRERLANIRELRIEDPELLLCVCEALLAQAPSLPGNVRDEADFFYGFVQSKVEIGLYDERDYFLGEFALLAGIACRLLFRRDEARRWFDRAEARFVLTVNSAVNIARLAYQRLALRVEERSFDEVLEFAPIWFEAFSRLDLPQDALKCRFLEAAALREVGRLQDAVSVLDETCQRAEASGNVSLLAQGLNNLAQFHRMLGDLKEALAYASKALPMMQQLGNRIGIAKLHWCVGDILREQGQLGDAVEAYRAALREAEEIGIRGDVAAIHLVLADVLLDAGFDRQAEWEIRAALPIIEEEKMVPEGYAALALLQESLRRRKIDRQALRNLHVFFQDEKS